ncbi:hypothetical protein DVJ77_17205 [Dyella tabacisoli]|uniref:Uncharacterized protein n=1 Tax=Dyella tabacisoli TaxID=2282381 RepID=A0A369UPX3_9GAMM|nr:hypothetical protein DVJ77_17205 [Dyella tabacisoli]
MFLLDRRSLLHRRLPLQTSPRVVLAILLLPLSIWLRILLLDSSSSLLYLLLPLPLFVLLLLPSLLITRVAALLHFALLKMLRYYIRIRTIPVIFRSNRILLCPVARIARTRILPLVIRQWRSGWYGSAIPTVPATSTLLPVTSPVLTSAWRRVNAPA